MNRGNGVRGLNRSVNRWSAILNNKKGAVGEQMQIFFFIFMLVVIGGGIVIGAAIFYGTGYDARAADAADLDNSISKCLSSDGMEINWASENDFYEKCKFDKEAFGYSHVVGILINGDENEKFKYGDYKSCELTGKKNVAYPLCSISNFKVGENYYKVVVGSTQRARVITK